MAAIPKIQNLVQHLIESTEVRQENRTYLGMSGIGRKCSREQWYSWRWATAVSVAARVERIFRRGDLEEPRIVADLEKIGIKFYDDQYEVVHFTGHCKGHIDGKLDNVPGAEQTTHLAEFKTMSNKRFNALIKKTLLVGFEAALKDLHPEYWCQIQLYMKYAKLTWCLFVVTNKDNEERLYERVKFYPTQAELMDDHALSIIISEVPPDRISSNPSWYECKYCDFNNICFNLSTAAINCRTCEFSDLRDEGKWCCQANENKELSVLQQKEGCELHSYIKGV